MTSRKTERFEFRTTEEFLARIDAIRGETSRAKLIEQLCEFAIRIKFPAPNLTGLTATPCQADRKSIDVFDRMITKT